jgi:hypothetical protein
MTTRPRIERSLPGEIVPARLVPITSGTMPAPWDPPWMLPEDPLVPAGVQHVFCYAVRCGYPHCVREFGRLQWTDSPASPYMLLLNPVFTNTPRCRDVFCVSAETAKAGRLPTPHVLLRGDTFGSPRVEWERRRTLIPYIVAGGMRQRLAVECDADGAIQSVPRLIWRHELPIRIVCDRGRSHRHVVQVEAPKLPRG